MKASELRIGNLVLNGFGNEDVVDGITESIIRCKIDTGCKIEGINPIPLTEEWLVKRGFEKHDNPEWRLLYGNANDDEYMYIDFSKEILYLKAGYKGEIYVHPFKGIQHVHQLQNIYFALTNEELTICQDAKS